MLRRLFAGLLSLLVFVGVTLAATAIVVKYEKGTMKLTVKEGDKERVLQLKKGTHVHNSDGSEVSVKGRPDKLKKGVKIEIEEDKGKVIEINIKK